MTKQIQFLKSLATIPLIRTNKNKTSQNYIKKERNVIFYMQLSISNNRSYTASVVSVQLISERMGTQNYKILITNVVGVMYDPLFSHNDWIKVNSNTIPAFEVTIYDDMSGPDLNNIIKDVVICKPTTDLTGSGDLQISTE